MLSCVVGHSGDGRILVILVDCSDLACRDGLFVCSLSVSVLFICCCCGRRLVVVVGSSHCDND